MALTFSSLLVLAPSAQAAASITLTKSAPGSVLAGKQVTYTLTATNPGTDPLYNISFRDVLPDGVRYVSGSTSPAEFGEPDPSPPVISAAGLQTVLWSNVTDLQPGSSATLTFKASFDTVLYPVGSSFTNSATVHGSTNPRTVPKFLPNGTPIPSASVISDAATAGPTVVAPFEITKTEGSLEGELLRGVHDHTTTYTLRIENNKDYITSGTVLTDYLPAQLEFLGCGGVDNTRIDSGTGLPTEEYPTSGTLAGTPTPADCTFPNLVSTVSDPPQVGSTVYPPGVYTRLQWNLAALTPGQVVIIRYAAGIPLQANTTDWTARPGGAPSAASGLQASNLDNNTGLSTRETTTEQSVTNIARLTGSYQGPLAPGTVNPLAADASKTVSVEDVRMQKSVSPAKFQANQIATFTLNVDVSEYVNASNIVLTDTLPNGYCPLSSTDNFVSGAPIDCDPIPGTDPVGADYASAPAQQGTGEFLITFTPLTVAANGSATVTFQAKMRENYTGGSLADTPTTSGDTFTNTAQLTGTTLGLPGTGQPGTADVLDESSATQTTDALTLNKKVLPRAVPQDCSDTGYVDDTEIAAPGFDKNSVAFRKGDRVCFQLEVNFPTTTAARNVVITDVIPDGTRYEAGSNTVLGGGGVPIEFNEDQATLGNEFPTWNVGFPTGTGSDTYVLAGTILVLRFSVLVERAADGATIDITGNLMKMRSASSNGQVRSYRDEVPFGIIPAPPVPVVKGVASINGNDLNAPPAPIAPAATGRDGETVREGDVVTFRVDVTNGGDFANLNGFNIRGLQVWDVLPAGIECAQISAISAVSSAPGAPVGTCTNPFQSGHPTFSLSGSRSAITWNFRTGLAGDPDQITSGATRTLTYDMSIPNPSSVATTYENTAYVRSFDAFTNQFDVTATYYPSDNVDTSVDPAEYSGPPSDDVSSVVLPNTTFVKDLVTTSLNEQNNNAGSAAGGQAVNGEGVTYSVKLDIPARTSVFNGTVTDPLSAATWILDSSSLTFFPDAASTTTGSVPGGVTFNAATGALNLGATYTNASDTPQRFEITLNTRVTPGASAGGKTNTATFSRTPSAAGGTPVTKPDTATLTVRIPNPTLAKENSAAGSVRAGDVVTYTLRATNQVNTPPAHDTVVIDCVPAGLTFGSYGALTQGTTVPPVPGDGTKCAPGTTQLQWNVGTVLGGTTSPNAPDAGESLAYTATVNPSAAAGSEYENLAALTASTLPNGVNDPAVERILGSPAKSKVTVTSSTLTKTVTPQLATIGETVNYTVNAVIPANVNFYDAALIDNLPKGIDASSLQLQSLTCAFVPSGIPCTVGSTALAPSTKPDGSTSVGWYVGTIVSNPEARAIRIRYSAVVADNAGPQPVRGDALTNTVSDGWFLTADPNRPQPTVDTTFEKTGGQVKATVTVKEPNVTLAKSVDDTSVEPGQSFQYSVDISNPNSNGSDATVSTAFNLEVTDTVPNGVVVLAPVINGTFTPDADPSDGGGTIVWSLDRLDPGDSTQRTYLARLADSPKITGASLTNTVRATAYRSLDNAGRTYSCPSCATATSTVTPALPKLQLTKTALGGEPTYIGDNYPWRITVKNTGTGAALDVTVNDTLPPNWRYVAGTSVITRPGGTAPEAPSDSTIVGDTQSLQWDALTDLLPGESVIVEFDAQPLEEVVDNPTVGSAVRQENLADAAAIDGALFPGYDSPLKPYTASSQASTRIDSADLVISKSHDTPPEPAAGAVFNWKITVENADGDVAVGPFTVTDDLPVGVIANGTPSGPGWTCTAPDVDGRFTCLRTNVSDTLASGAAFPDISVPVKTDPSTPDGTIYENTAEVQARTYDPDSVNNTANDEVTLRTEADVKIVKKLSGSVVAGQNSTYTLDVSNLGPSTALGDIVVTDTLPGGSTLVSADGGTDWDCPVPGPTGSTLECTYLANGGDLLPGATNTITVVLKIPADQSVAVKNSATVDSPTTPETDTSNNTDSVTTPLTTSADLAITKTSRGELIAGKPGTYRFVVDNLGPSDAQDVKVIDTLPTGLTYTGFADVTGTWNCGAVGQVVTCTLTGALAANASATVDIDVKVASSVLGTITNTADVTSTTPDPDGGNNSWTDESDFAAEADVFIEKTDSPDPVVAGEQLTYTLRIGNDGPSDAAGPIVVTDVLPAQTSFVSVTPDDTGSPWSCVESAGTVTCTRSTTLQAGDDGSGDTITVKVDVDPSAGPGTISNTATVDSQTTPEPSGGAANNSSTTETTVVDDVELTLTKATTGESSPVAGDPAGTEFTLTVTNKGPSTADDVVVTDTMPAGLVPVSASGTDWTCEVPSGQEIVCRRDTFEPGTSTIVVKAKVAASVLDGTKLTNSANVITTTPGDDPDDNTGTSFVRVVAEADLAVTKSHEDGTYRAGDDITFDIGVKNNGFSDAQPTVTVLDTLPAGFTYVGKTGPWTCVAASATPAGQEVTCTLDGSTPLAAKTSAPALQVIARISPSVDPTVDPDDYVNTAEVSSGTTDPIDSNDKAEDPIEVTSEADLAITKTHAAPVRIGDDVTFSLAVENKGPSEARNVEVTDTLPAGLTYVSSAVSDPSGTCTEVSAKVTCTLDDPLPPKGTAAITITATVEVAAYPSVINTARVSSSTPDPKPLNNESADKVTVPPQVDLSVTKSHNGSFAVGGQGIYTIAVSNTGPTEDPGAVTVVDELPTGLTFVSGTGDGWTCSAKSQTVTCVRDEGLVVDETSPIALTVSVGAAAAPSVVNTVSVSSPAEDLDPTNNNAQDPTTVEPLSILTLAKDLTSLSGDRATYALTVTNTGPNATTEPIVLTDSLPMGLTFVSAKGNGWVCTSVAPTVTCTYSGTLAVGATTVVTIVTAVDAQPGQQIKNVATVGGGSNSGQTSSDDALLTMPPAAMPATGMSISVQLLLAMALILMAAGSGLRVGARTRRTC